MRIRPAQSRRTSAIAAAIIAMKKTNVHDGIAGPMKRHPCSAHSPLTPWAWGGNACTSGVAAVAATLLAMNLGFGAVLVLAVALYAVAASGPTVRSGGGALPRGHGCACAGDSAGVEVPAWRTGRAQVRSPYTGASIEATSPPSCSTQ